MNQDSLGIQGLLVQTVNKIEVGDICTKENTSVQLHNLCTRFLIQFSDIITESDIYNFEIFFSKCGIGLAHRRNFENSCELETKFELQISV